VPNAQVPVPGVHMHAFTLVCVLCVCKCAYTCARACVFVVCVGVHVHAIALVCIVCVGMNMHVHVLIRLTIRSISHADIDMKLCMQRYTAIYMVIHVRAQLRLCRGVHIHVQVCISMYRCAYSAMYRPLGEFFKNRSLIAL
jgi:hypothetical protein